MKNNQAQLPRIFSQKRVVTTSSELKHPHDTIPSTLRAHGIRADTAKISSKNKQFRKTTVSANSVTKLKQETAGSMAFRNKLDNLEKQKNLLDRQINAVQRQIEQLRNQKYCMQKEKDPTISRTSLQSNVSRNHGNQDEKTQTTLICNLRRKIDRKYQINSQIQNEVDGYRRQIFTLKGKNQKLAESVSLMVDKYEQARKQAEQLEGEISRKNQLLHKNKIAIMHNKGRIIKQYNGILKRLDKELDSDRVKGRQQKNNMYITGLQMQIQSPKYTLTAEYLNTPSYAITPNHQSPKHRQNKTNTLRDHISVYQSKLDKLKQKLGSKDINQITQSFLNQYQGNFDNYKFINKLYEDYVDLQAENHKLKLQRSELQSSLNFKGSRIKQKELVECKEKLGSLKKMISQLQKQEDEYQATYVSLKKACEECLLKIKQHKETVQITPENLRQVLELIYMKWKQQETASNLQQTTTAAQLEEYLNRTGKEQDQNRKDYNKKQKDNRQKASSLSCK